MPHSFSNHARARPMPQLFAVHHLAEKESCCAQDDEMQFENLEAINIDNLADCIDRLIEDEEIFEDLPAPTLSPQARPDNGASFAIPP